MVIADAPPRFPWWTIWFRPQATIRAILERGAGRSVLVIAALAGITAILASRPTLSWPTVLLIAVLAGPPLGLMSLYLGGALIAWSGRLVGGHAPQSTIRTAVGWSLLPDVVALPVWLGSFLFFGQEFIRQLSGEVTNVAILVILLLLAVLAFWRLFLIVRTIGAVQGFGIWRSIVSSFLPTVLLLALAIGVRTFAFQPFSTPSGSMEPTLIVGDNFFVSKFSYGWSRYSFPFDAGFERIFGSLPQRGDLVVFKLPRDNATDYVKRIVGMPGDEILLQNGVLHINGVAVQKTVSDQAGIEFSKAEPGMTVYTETLPEGRQYTVVEMEENGPFDNVGPYKVPAGHYFVLGDNRDNSTDSRAAWGVGFVPYDNLLGRVELIYFSADPSSGGANMRWKRMFSIPR